MRPVKTIVLAKLLLTVLLLANCATFQQIPAESTPLREARYYRGQDAGYFAAGLAADQVARLFVHGPTDRFGQRQRCDSICHPIETFRTRTGENAPLVRVAAIGAAALIQRQTDRGYRESGGLMVLLGAFSNELLHVAVAVIRRHF